MRTHPRLQLIALGTAIAVLACAGCSGGRRGQADASPSPAPLQSCETRLMSLDGVDVELVANADGSLGAINVLKTPDASSAAKVRADIVGHFGQPRTDSRVVARSNKWGLTTLTDPCGRPARSASP